MRVASTAWVLERSPTQALPCFTASHAYSIWWILPCEHGSSVSNAGSRCVGGAASRHSRPPDPRVRRRRGHQGHEARCESHLRAPRDAIRVVLRERGMYGSAGCGSPGRPYDKLVDETNNNSSGVVQSRSTQSPGCGASCDSQLCAMAGPSERCCCWIRNSILPTHMVVGNSVEQWFRALPPVTRWHFASVVIVTLAGNFGLVNPVSIALLQEQVFKKFEATLTSSLSCDS